MRKIKQEGRPECVNGLQEAEHTYLAVVTGWGRLVVAALKWMLYISLFLP